MFQKYASDIVSSAMRMAQQQAMNSFAFRDVLEFLNRAWRVCYERMAQIDEGFYSTTVKLDKELTTLPPFVMHTVLVYAAADPMGTRRQVFTHSGSKNMTQAGTFHMSGFDLYCRDATRRDVWLNFVPMPEPLFYTSYNRDPNIINDLSLSTHHYKDPVGALQSTRLYGMYELEWETYNNDPPNRRYIMKHRGNPIHLQFDVTGAIYRGPDYDDVGKMTTVGTSIRPPTELYNVDTVILDHPWIFVTYQHKATGEYSSYLLKNIMGTVQRFRYNPFDFTGRGSNVQFLKAGYNDDTGMGVIIKDWDDIDYVTGDPKIKELGWTPDTLVTYPHDVVCDYLVAVLAQRITNRNESSSADVDYAFTKANEELDLWYKRNKSGLTRIHNVNGPRVIDFL